MRTTGVSTGPGEDVLALLPWLLGPDPASPPPVGGPDEGMKDVVALLPWLAEVDPRPPVPSQQAVDEGMKEVVALLPWLAEVVSPPWPLEQPDIDEVAELLPWLREPVPDDALALADLDDLDTLRDLFPIEPALPWLAGDDEEGAVHPIKKSYDDRLRHHAWLGVNAPKVGRYADPDHQVYGTTADILADLDSLGARYIRQPAGADLVWPEGVEIPVVGLAADGTLAGDDNAAGDEMYERVFTAPHDDGYGHTLGTDEGSALATHLLAFLEELSGHNQRAVLTIFSGGNLGFTNSRASSNVDASGEYNITDPAGVSTVDWSSAHLSAPDIAWWGTGDTFSFSEYVSGAQGGFDALSTSLQGYDPAADRGFLVQTMDWRSPYKLKYLYYIGWAYGKLLAAVNEVYEAAHKQEIWSLIAGIEFFNEANGASTFNILGVGELVDRSGAITYQARCYSLALREIVRGFQQALADSGLARPLPLWLPSLAGYKVPDSAATDASWFTFDALLSFQRSLCTALVTDFSAVVTGAPTADFSWFQNQDYHYYNYRENQAAGPIFRLAAELSSLRRTFLPLAAGGTGVQDLAGHSLTISVSETAAADDTSPDLIALQAYRYLDDLNSRLLLTSDVSERFQAREVWRRLSVASIQARRVAWHTHMATVEGSPGSTSGFSYTGLRRDVPLAEDTSPNDVEQRMSHWAYKRLAGLAAISTNPLVDGQIIAAFVNSLPRSMDRFQMDFDPSKIRHVGIAIHFVKRLDEHWYLLQIDPTSTVATTITATLSVRGYIGPGDNELWAAVPPTMTATLAGSGTGFATRAPDSATWDAPLATGPGMDPFTIRFDGTLFDPWDPVLVKSTNLLYVTWG